MDPLTVLAIAEKAKDFTTKKVDSLAGGLTQIGGIYSAGGGFGTQPQNQQVQSAPMFQGTQTQRNNMPGQYSFLPNTSNYVPNTDFSQRVAGKQQPNKLFDFISNGG
jgi:hypothetical protein